MASWFHDLAIRHKLLVLSAATSFVALAATTAAFLVYDQLAFRESLARQLESQAQIVAANSASALSFNDSAAAAETLRALSAVGSIRRAALYTADDRLFAWYAAPGVDTSGFPRIPFPARGHDFSDQRLHLTEPVVIDDETVGVVWIESGMNELIERRFSYVIIVLPVLLGSIVLAYLIASFLQRVIARPIVELAQAARRISLEKDYSVRVRDEGRDELGQLVATFNDMLARIQQRDDELQRARDELERRVEERTTDLRDELAERKRTEVALLRSEHLLAEAQRLARIGSWQWEIETDRLVWSDELYRIYGIDRDRFDGSYEGLLALVHPDDRDRVRRHVQQALERGGSFSLEHRILHPDGTERMLSAIGHTVVDGQGRACRMFGTGQDVTERYRAEQEREARIRAETAQAEARAAQRRADLLAQIGSELASPLETEPALDRLLRLVVPEIADWAAIHLEVDESVRLAAVVHTDPRLAELTRRMERSARGAGWAWWVDAVLKSQRGRTIDAPTDELRQLFESALAAPLTARGKSFGVLTVGIRERDPAAGALDQALIEGIASRIASAADNTRLYREAQEANRMKDQFLATLSHELRTPLNAIVGWVQILREGAFDEKVKARAVETIGRNAKVQKQLIEDMLDVSRIVSGKLQLDVRPVELHRVIEAAADSVRPAADAKEITLDLDLDHAAGPVQGDPDRLQQVVWNLLSNAIKFTPRGGRVTVRLRGVAEWAEIVVEDTGIGIPAEHLDRIFERFSQVDASSTRTHRGLGLGLAIVRHLVELHGGTVEASSAGTDRGSTFVVHLPLQVDRPEEESVGSAAPSAEGAAAPANPLAGVSVVVVDDEEDARVLLGTLLRRMGAAVRIAGSADEALTLVERERPDVLLSDIEMPGEDGYTLIRRLRMLPAGRGSDVPAAAVTAYARAEDRERALAAGFQRHVAKPIEPESLADLVLELAAQRHRAGRHG